MSHFKTVRIGSVLYHQVSPEVAAEIERLRGLLPEPQRHPIGDYQPPLDPEERRNTPSPLALARLEVAALKEALETVTNERDDAFNFIRRFSKRVDPYAEDAWHFLRSYGEDRRNND